MDTTRSLQNVLKLNNGLRSTRTADPPTCFDPKPSVHKPNNSLVHVEKKEKPKPLNEENQRHFADLRLKLGEKRVEAQDTESLPSDLSQDEWVEIVNYQK